MSNVGLAAVMLVAFALAIRLVEVASRLIDAGAPGDGRAGAPPSRPGRRPGRGPVLVPGETSRPVP